MAMKLLSLAIFCTEKGQVDATPARALRRVSWAMDQINLALRKPESAPGKLLAESGYCCVVLVNPDGKVHHVEGFDDGYTAVILPDGTGVEVTDKEPQTNATACLQFLDVVERYCRWVEATETALMNGTRPPAMEADFDRQYLHDWIGQTAHPVHQAWLTSAHERAAVEAAAPKALRDPSFEEELVIVAPADHPPIKSARDAREGTILVFETGCPHRRRLEIRGPVA